MLTGSVDVAEESAVVVVGSWIFKLTYKKGVSKADIRQLAISVVHWMWSEPVI